jgi:hypothetical protein
MIKYDNSLLNDMLNNIYKDKIDNNIKIYLDNILLDINNNLKKYIHNKDYKLNIKSKKNKGFINNTNNNTNNNSNTNINNTNTNNNTNINNTNTNTNTNNTNNTNTNNNNTNNNNTNNNNNNTNNNNTNNNNTNNNNIKNIEKNLSKTDIELDFINLKKILNKITEKNYDKLKTEFICNYNNIIVNKDIECCNILNLKIVENLLYNDSIYSKLYSNLLKNIIDLNELSLKEIINFKKQDFIQIYKLIKYQGGNEEEIMKKNKENDKNKNMCYFYISCLRYNIINEEDFYKCILNLHKFFIEELNKTNNKDICEEIVNFILIILNKNFDLLTDEHLQEISEKILYVKQLKLNEIPSLTNKIKFKFMDLYDEYKKLNIKN